jgi:hypothetical protein
MIIEEVRRPSMSHRHPRVRLALAVLATALLLVTACGKRSAGRSTTTVATTATVPDTTTADTTTTVPETTAVTSTTVDHTTSIATITANWEEFFLPTTSIDDRVALLENGESLRQALVLRAADPLQQQASAKVKKVELTAPDRATVTYDVSLNGVVALADSQGTAVLQAGVWKVGAESFCALVSLGATGPIPGCG